MPPPGPIIFGVDPCGLQNWQGFECENGNIIGITLSGENLGGKLDDDLGWFTSIRLLDVSGNGLTNELPYSMGNLSSLTTLHLQNNQLSGTLDVLQNLHLRDLNVDNNMFSGTIPEKLLSVPNFKRDGNPIDTTILPSPPASPPTSYSDVLSPPLAPGTKADGPSSSQLLGFRRKEKKSDITWLGIAGLLVTGILASVLCLLMSLSL